MTDHPNSKNPKIKNIKTLEQLLSSYLVADAIIEIREERQATLKNLAHENIPTLNVDSPILQDLYNKFAKLVGYRYPFLYMAKIGIEDMVKYKFFDDPSVVTNASNDVAHLNSQFGANYTILSKVNLLDHTLNVFNNGMEIGESKGRVMQIAIPMLGCLFHDFGKSELLRQELVGNNVGKVYKAHAEVSSMYIKEIMSVKYHELLNEQPIETIEMLAKAVSNHHPKHNKDKSDTTIAFIIEADNKARKQEFKKLQLELKKR